MMTKVRKLIRGKFDSQYRHKYFYVGNKLVRSRGVKYEKGHFRTPMQYACDLKHGMNVLRYAAIQPWETWKKIG